MRCNALEAASARLLALLRSRLDLQFLNRQALSKNFCQGLDGSNSRLHPQMQMRTDLVRSSMMGLSIGASGPRKFLTEALSLAVVPPSRQLFLGKLD